MTLIDPPGPAQGGGGSFRSAVTDEDIGSAGRVFVKNVDTQSKTLSTEESHGDGLSGCPGTGEVAARRSRAHAWLLNAATTPFYEINYRGSCAAAVVFDRRRMVGTCDRVIAALKRKLAREPERNLRLGMAFPSRWDPFFADSMTLADVYRYPVQHFDFHRQQLTIGGGPR